MSDARPWIPYDFAVIRIVPHPHLGNCVPVGVVLHAPAAAFLGMRIVSDAEALSRRVADVDLDVLVRYLRALDAIVRGDADGGPIALVSPSERFHWVTAPRSDVIESGPVHSGLCQLPAETLDDLFRTYVLEAGRSPARPAVDP